MSTTEIIDCQNSRQQFLIWTCRGLFQAFMFSQVDIFIEKPFFGNYYGKQLPLTSGLWGFDHEKPSLIV